MRSNSTQNLTIPNYLKVHYHAHFNAKYSAAIAVFIKKEQGNKIPLLSPIPKPLTL
jgi:hypothetical protein